MGPTYDLSDLPSAMKKAIGKEFGRVLVKPNLTAISLSSNNVTNHSGK
jgi:hypothetical protein